MYYVTYDIQQGDPQHSGKVRYLRGVKEVPIFGKILSFEVGEFDSPSGGHIYGARIEYQGGDEVEHPEHPQIDMNSILVEVPATAQNVRLHEDELPSEYQSARESTLKVA